MSKQLKTSSFEDNEFCPVPCTRRGCKNRCGKPFAHDKGFNATRHMCQPDKHVW